MDLSFVRLTKAGEPGPDNRRIYLGDEGVFIGPGCALIRAKTDLAGRKSYKLRTRSEIVHLLDAGYGFHFGLDGLMRSLNAIAKALDGGDLGLAWIGALQLGLPALPDGAAVSRMAAADRLLKYNFNPDEPRDSHGRWTTDGSADADPQPQLVTQNVPSPAPAQSDPPSHVHFSGWDKLSPKARRGLARTGDLYYEKRGRDLTVTSGKRTPRDQAQAMYDNLQRNSTPHYSNQAAFHQIVEAYYDALATGAGEQAAVNAMTSVIEQQVSQGVYISAHLTGDAVDIRSRDMSDEEIDELEEAATSAGAQVIIETNNIHLQF